MTHAARSRPPSKRSISDAALDERILALREEPFNATLGSKKTWRLPGSRQEGPRVARCTVERRMRVLGLTGAGPGRTVRTTGPAKGNPVPDDLLHRDSRRRPVRTGAGWSTSPTCRPGTGFLVAPPSSRGLCATAASSAGATSTRMDADFVLGALEQATRGAKAPRRR